jgi:hypothetical protein
VNEAAVKMLTAMVSAARAGMIGPVEVVATTAGGHSVGMKTWDDGTIEHTFEAGPRQDFTIPVDLKIFDTHGHKKTIRMTYGCPDCEVVQ